MPGNCFVSKTLYQCSNLWAINKTVMWTRTLCLWLFTLRSPIFPFPLVEPKITKNDNIIANNLWTFKTLIILNLLDPHIPACIHRQMHKCYFKEKSGICDKNVINDRFLHILGYLECYETHENDWNDVLTFPETRPLSAKAHMAWSSRSTQLNETSGCDGKWQKGPIFSN